MVGTDEVRRAQHVAADGVDRADARLRQIGMGRRVGHAVMCPGCDGDGVVLAVVKCVTQPVTCKVCNGDGLDPHARQGAAS